MTEEKKIEGRNRSYRPRSLGVVDVRRDGMHSNFNYALFPVRMDR